MRKRIFAGLLAFMMMLSIVPVTEVSAETTSGPNLPLPISDGVIDTDQELRDAVAAGGEITLGGSIDLSTAVVVTKDTTVNLNGKTLSVSNDTVGDGVFHVTAGTLTINGEGTVNGVGKNKWNIAIWADGGNVIINGGIYTNEGAGDEDSYDLIYAKNGGTVTINGGTFIAETTKWTLNCNDKTPDAIKVKGGTFKEFNPAEVYTELEQPINFVTDGYYSVADGNGNYVVKAVNKADVTSEAELRAAVKAGGEITLGGSIDLATAVIVEKDTTLNLNGNTLSVSKDKVGDGVFHVKKVL